MSPRKIQGGAEILTRLRDYAVAIREQLQFDRKLLVLKPERIEDRRDEALEYLRLLITALDTDLPPLLERNERNREAASIPDRVAALEATTDALRATIQTLRTELDDLQRRVEGRSVRLVDPARGSNRG